ncbi:MAG TPA: CPBP family intramembrane metalloprotease [Firmicutes bacterium]|nr:CPBP family intramembrane metalloprotease [Bacillota bacterium]
MLRSINRTAMGLAVFLVAALLAESATVYSTLKPPLAELVGALAYVGISLLFVFILQSFFDKRRFAEIGLKLSPGAAWRRVVRGTLVGGGAMAIVPIVQWLVGAVTYQRVAAFTWAIPLSGFFRSAGVAFGEELFFRGYIMQMLRRRHGLIPAMVVSSLVFSVIHYVNPGYAPLVLINVFAIGVLLVLMVAESGSLWSAIGFHLGWNWVQMTLLEVVPPQGSRFQGLVVFTERAGVPTLLTGGGYGPEATIIVTAVIAVLLVRSFKRIARQGGLE